MFAEPGVVQPTGGECMSVIDSIDVRDNTGALAEYDGDREPRREEIFELLSNARRRQIVHALLQRDQDEVTLRELSRLIAGWENGVDPEAVTTTQRKRVYTALRQSHLPRLADTGFVRYDDDRSIVRPTEKVSDLRVYLEIVPGEEIPWSVYYAGLGVFLLSVTLAKAVGLFPFSEVPALGLAAFFGLMVTGSGLIHVYNHRQMRLGSDGSPPSQ